MRKGRPAEGRPGWGHLRNAVLLARPANALGSRHACQANITPKPHPGDCGGSRRTVTPGGAGGAAEPAGKSPRESPLREESQEDPRRALRSVLFQRKHASVLTALASPWNSARRFTLGLEHRLKGAPAALPPWLHWVRVTRPECTGR